MAVFSKEMGTLADLQVAFSPVASCPEKVGTVTLGYLMQLSL